ARGVLHLDADTLGELVAGLANLQVPRMPIVSNALAVGADRISDSVLDPDAAQIILYETLLEQVLGEALFYSSRSVSVVGHAKCLLSIAVYPRRVRVSEMIRKIMVDPDKASRVP